MPYPRPLNDSALQTLSRRYFLRDKDGNITEDWPALAKRVAKYLSSCEKDKELWEDRFFTIIRDRLFIPNSPVLSNAGTDMKQMSACFVLPVGDSIDEIFDAIKNAAIIHKYSGGTGFSFSDIRPAKSVVKTTSGVASGPVSFMKVFNSATEAIKQGGKRRGANMGVLSVHHPDILEFISCKSEEGEVKNFNISVGVTDAFMRAMEDGTTYDIISPLTGEVVDHYDARDVFTKMCEGAWANGEPGCLFMDTINRHHNMRKSGTIKATNPCGEVPLLPYESCVLGSIDVGKFVTCGKDFEWGEMRSVIDTAVRLLDNIITLQVCPVPEVDKVTQANRKIGLGVMGLADALVKMEIPYGSRKSYEFAEQLARFLKTEAHVASVALGREKGVTASVSENYEQTMDGIELDGFPRNSCQISIAPTGTIAQIADCSNGIEPFFDVSYFKNVMDTRIYFTMDSIKEALRYYKLDDQIREIERGAKISELSLPKKVADLLQVSYTLTPEQHVKMQAIFQKYCDQAVSKTINMPYSATLEDVWTAYMLAYKLGCKGITVYRDGSRVEQVVDVGTPKQKGKRPAIVDGKTHEVPTVFGDFYMTVNLVKNEPFEIFLMNSRVTADVGSMVDAITLMCSLALQANVPWKTVVRQLKKVRNGSAPVRYDSKTFYSIPAAMGGVIEATMRDHVKIEYTTICDKCGGQVTYQDGCSMCMNPECGESRCG